MRSPSPTLSRLRPWLQKFLRIKQAHFKPTNLSFIKGKPMLKLLVVYAHLLATCLALGSILVADWRMFRERHQRLRPEGLAGLAQTQRIANSSLAALWVSGALLVLLGYADQSMHYLLNQKLWAKISVVSLLTLNGVLLHRYAFPALRQGVIPAYLPARKRHALATLGGISGASWLFAALLGIARPWNHTLAYPEVMSLFAGVLAFAVMAAISVSGRALLPRAPVALGRTSRAGVGGVAIA